MWSPHKSRATPPNRSRRTILPPITASSTARPPYVAPERADCKCAIKASTLGKPGPALGDQQQAQDFPLHGPSLPPIIVVVNRGMADIVPASMTRACYLHGAADAANAKNLHSRCCAQRLPKSRFLADEAVPCLADHGA